MRIGCCVSGLVAAVLFVSVGGGSLLAANYAIDGAHSSVAFGIKHSDLNFVYGLFSNISGHFAVDESGDVDVTINADSIYTGVEGRDNHLKSPDFFNARQFPEISFKSSEISKVDDDTYELKGELTMLGMTKPVTAKCTMATGTGRGGDEKGGLVTSFSVKRSDFKLGGPGGVSDEVKVMVSLQGTAE
jgi:polyisoprenoid-binding protein YceI